MEATQPRVEPSGQAPPERERLATEAPAVEVPAKTGRPTSFPARGIVRDVRDLPIAGVGIGTAVDEKAGTVRVRSGADGSFAVDLPRYIATLIAIDPEWATLRASRYSAAEPDREHLIVVAPLVEVGGTVVDADGRPLPGAIVEVMVPAETLAEIAELQAETEEWTWRARTDGEGRFGIPRAPSLSGSRLAASLAGYRPYGRNLPASPTTGLVLVLEPWEEIRSIVAGVVVHADGRPAATAVVALGNETTKAGEDGAFRFAPPPVAPETPLVAASPGSQPAVLERFGERLLRGPFPIESVRLTLGGPSLLIEGKVLDADGAGLKRWRVALVDGLRLNPGSEPARYAELLGGRADRAATTRKGGGFVIDGLADRVYTLRAWSQQASVFLRSEPVRAGTLGVVLQLPAEERVASLRGQVVSLSGAPVPGVRVFSGGLGGSILRLHPPKGPFVTTDPSGRFEAQDVPRAWIQLSVYGEGILPGDAIVAPGDLSGEIFIRVRKRRRFVFASADPKIFPDSIQVRDPKGEVVSLWSTETGLPSSSAPLVAGRSQVLAVSEEATELAVLRGGRLVGQLNLTLSQDSVDVVRWP